MTLRHAALTDIGKIRSENEDRFVENETLGLFGVADGIGGLPGGAEAAECTVQNLQRLLTAAGQRPDLVRITQEVSAEVAALGETLNPDYGIGSTLVYGRFLPGALQVVHVGDSRCYRLRHGELRQLSEDHTVENEVRLMRSRGQTVDYPVENLQALTRCIGQPGVPDVELQNFDLIDGDRLLFSTDGITRMIDEYELAEIMRLDASPRELLEEMIFLSMQRGGYDNLTAVLVFVDAAR